jgi:hypothetical protein
MINQITSYKELIQEKARLKALLVEQELQIKEDWQLIRDDLRPFALAGATIRKLLTRKAGISVAHLGINLLADGFIKKVLLARTGWVMRLVVPFLVKNYGSHLVDEPGKILQKIKNLFGKNGKMHQETGMDAV